MKKTYLTLLLLACLLPVFGQWQIDEDFEGITTLPAGWTYIDDGDNMTWRNLNNASHAHSGTRAAFCDNYFPNQNADWLITPQLAASAGDSLQFWTRSWVGTENQAIYVSTTGTAAANFSTQLLNLQDLGTTYQYFAADLSAFAGQQIYLGFYWECENYGILVDDVRVGQPLIVTPELNLPETFSFFQGDELTVDFSPWCVATELASASLSWQPTQHVNVSAQGLNVTFSSPDWSGTETVVFTLQDQISGLTATDSADIVVNPLPAVDLAWAEILSPGPNVWVGTPFTPSAELLNNGQNLWNSEIRLVRILSDSSGTQIGSEELFLNALLQPGQASAVNFSPLTLWTAGNYTLSFLIDLDDGNPANNSASQPLEVILRVNQGGPDAFGFRYLDSTAPGGPAFDWIDISATGASTVMYGVNQWYGDDNFSEPIPFGFNFPFYGSSYDAAMVDINGEILLAPNNWYEPFPGLSWDNDGNMFNYMYPLPGYTQMPGLIAAYWDDLYVEQGTGNIYFQAFGTSPDRYTVIQWHNVRYLAGSGATSLLDFEVIFHENGEIVMQYNSTATHQTGASIPHDNGRSATVGLQNASADIGLCYLREIVQNNQYVGVEPAGNLLFDGLAIRFFSGPDEQPPVITHRQPGNTFQTSLELTARVLDLNALDTVEVVFCLSDENMWGTASGTPTGDGYYSFVLPQFQPSDVLRYYFHAVDALGNAAFLPVDESANPFNLSILPSCDAEVLIVYSGSQDYQRLELPVYQARLEALGIAYDIYDWEEYPSYTFPDYYSTLLVYASVGGPGLKGETLATALMNWLELGSEAAPKNLFFASDGWASGQHGLPNSAPQKKLFNAYFRSFYAPTGGGGGTNGLAGPEVFSYENGSILCRNASPIGTSATEYSVYANSPDCIFRYEACPDWYASEVQFPEIGAVNAFTFEDGPIGGEAYLHDGVCATAVELPIYRAFYFSFDYSQLNDQSQSAALFADLMDWFDVQATPAVDPSVPALASRLHGAWPNPFNPSTTVRFSLASAGIAELQVYNLKGQKVRTLASGLFPAGEQSIVWDGSSDSGSALGSGIYFLRLKAGSLTQTKKLTLIK